MAIKCRSIYPAVGRINANPLRHFLPTGTGRRNQAIGLPFSQRWGFWLVVLLLGFYATIAQALLIREAMVVFLAGELALGMVFFAWLGGIAAGAGLAGLWLTRFAGAGPLLSLAGLLLTAALPCSISFLRISRSILQVPLGVPADPQTMLIACIVAVTPLAMLVGAAFPLCCQVYKSAATKSDPTAMGGIVAVVFAIESLGSLIGGLMFSLILIERVSNQAVVVLTAGCCLLAGCLVMIISRPRLITVGISVVVLTLVLWTGRAFSGAWEHWSIMHRWQDLVGTVELRESADSKYGNLAVGYREGQFSFYTDGHPVENLPDPQVQLVMHMYLCQHPEPKSVLLLGSGLIPAARAAEQHGLERLDYVQLDPRMGQLARDTLPAQIKAAMDAPYVKIHHGDARLLVKQFARSGAKYDLIICNFPQPSSVLLARYFSRQFFADLARLARPGGLLVLPLASPLTPQSQAITAPGLLLDQIAEPREFSGSFEYQSTRYLGCVLSALQEHWPVRLITYNFQEVFAARDQGVFTANRQQLVDRYKQRSKQVDDVVKGFLLGGDDRLDPDKLAWVKSVSDTLPTKLVNDELHPVAFLYSLMQWDKIVSGQSGWFYKLADRLKTWQAIGAGMLVLVLCAAGGLLGRGTFRPAVLVGSIGSTGAVTISAQLCLIFAYQGLYGFVYANIGLMVGLFMLGLVIGSVIIKQYVLCRMARWGHLAVVDMTMAAVLLAIPLAVRFLSSLQGSSTSQVLVHWLLMSIITITGIMGGLAFPLACQLLAQHRASQPRAGGIGAIAGQLDAAETFGSAGGALVTGVLMVPALGLTATAVTLACWKLTSAATLLLVKSDPKV